jgi:hypothetical protein
MYSYNQSEYALNENWNESNGLSYAAEVRLPTIRVPPTREQIVSH